MRKLLIPLSLVLAGCLPGDERPDPGRLTVSAAPAPETRDGFVSDDGWSVRFDRFVTAIGDVHLHGDSGEGWENESDSCNDYSETHYERLFDFAVAGAEKVGLVYGLGRCSVEYSMRSPTSDSIIGAGATQADIDLMTVRGTDDYVDDEEGERISLVAQGTAERDGVEKRFDWSFRRRYEIDRCPTASGEGYVSMIDLDGPDDLTLQVEVIGAELFRSQNIDEAPLLFEPYAGADADGDGAITLDELEQVLVPPESIVIDQDDDEGADPEPIPEDPTLRDLVYVYLLPRVTRIGGGGACDAENDSGGR